jgi:Methyltransferase domain
MKLHLGCGKRKIYGWTNIDIDPSVNPDIIDSIDKLTTIQDESAEIIYACHVLEHCKRKEIQDVLQLWYRKLSPNGILRIAVPSFEKAALTYIKDRRPLSDILGFLVGGQKTEFDFHYMVFDWNYLYENLQLAGYKFIKTYDWKDTEHFFIDDYSQAYLPHLDKGSGLLMSLNVECNKPL